MLIDLQAVEEAAKTLYIRALKMLPPDIKHGFERLQAAETGATAQRVLAIFRKELFSEPLPLGIISMSSRCGASWKSMWITGTSAPQELCSLCRVSGCTTELRSGCSRVARSQPRRMAAFSAWPSICTSRPIHRL